MRRSPFSRLIAATFFAIVTFAVLGEALTHGVAHHREHESDPHHTVADAHDVGSAVSAPDHDRDHQHPQLNGAVRTRLEGPTLVAALPVLVPEAVLVGLTPATPATPVCRATLARGDSQTGPPPRLRAPPAR